MNHSLIRRAAAVVVAPALTVTVLGAPSATVAAPPTPTAAASASWLGAQLTTGLVHNAEYGFDDYGLTVDVALAMDEVGGNGAMVRQVRQAMASKVADYTTGAPAGASTERYAGATAKAMVFAQATGADPRGFGGIDLVAATEARVIASGPSAGRLEDLSEWGDYANTFGQVFAARGLSNANSAKAAEVTHFLLQQQCPSGFFRNTFTEDKSAAQQGCVEGAATSQPDVDATALAVVHLSAIRTPGAPLRAAVEKAAQWLATTQHDDGSFGSSDTVPTPNSNSTGLAASALAAAGRCESAGRAAGWVAGLQVGAQSAASPLAGEEGAIAYDRAALDQAAASGIGASRDQWRRTTTQAVTGLAHQLSGVAGATFSAPGAGSPGEQVFLRASGLQAGARYCLAVPGIEGTTSVVVASDGELRVPVNLPATVGPTTYRIVGNDGSAAVTVEVRTGLPLAPVDGVKLTAPQGFQRAGAQVPLTVSGARAGDRFVLRGPASDEVEVVVASDGRLDRVVRLPWVTGPATWTLVGRGGESTATVEVLAATRLTVRVRHRNRVVRGARSRVVVSGLEPGEKVVVRLAGRKVASGRATSAGRFTRKVKIAARPGRRPVVATGQFAHRKGSARVRVRVP